MWAVQYTASRVEVALNADAAETASESAAVECCKILLQHEQGKNMLNAQNQDGDTALMYAARHNRPALIEYLLSHKETDPSITNNEGVTAAFVAAEFGYSDCEAKFEHGGRNRKQRGNSESFMSSSRAELTPKAPVSKNIVMFQWCIDSFLHLCTVTR